MRFLLLPLLVLLVSHSAGARTIEAPPRPVPLTATESASLDPEFEKDIHRLFDLVNLRNLILQQVDQMMIPTVNLLKSNPAVTPQFVDEWAKRFKAQLDFTEVERIETREYARYFSREEIQQMIAYQESPVGRKAIAVMPQMMSETGHQLGQLGQRLGAEIGTAIAREHPEYLRKPLGQGNSVTTAVPNTSARAGVADNSQSTSSTAHDHVPSRRLHPIKTVEPEYPPLAKATNVQGGVVFSAVIGTDGSVKSLKLISGHPLLVFAAKEAALQWEFEPAIVDGKPSEVTERIEVNFSLAPAH